MTMIVGWLWWVGGEKNNTQNKTQNKTKQNKTKQKKQKPVRVTCKAGLGLGL
jgi:hypothetical protein